MVYCLYVSVCECVCVMPGMRDVVWHLCQFGRGRRYAQNKRAWDVSRRLGPFQCNRTRHFISCSSLHQPINKERNLNLNIEANSHF